TRARCDESSGKFTSENSSWRRRQSAGGPSSGPHKCSLAGGEHRAGGHLNRKSSVLESSPTKIKQRQKRFAGLVPLLVVPEIVEDANKVAIEIGGDEFAQLPRFILGLRNDFRVRRFPLCEELIHLGSVANVEPEKHRASIAVGLPEGLVGQEQSAISPLKS